MIQAVPEKQRDAFAEKLFAVLKVKIAEVLDQIDECNDLSEILCRFGYGADPTDSMTANSEPEDQMPQFDLFANMPGSFLVDNADFLDPLLEAGPRKPKRRRTKRPVLSIVR